MANPLPPVHPGEVLKEDVLKPLGMSVNQLAKSLAVDAATLHEIIRGRRSITADTALRLSRYLGTSAEVWMNIQTRYDLEVARRSSQKQIEKAIKPREEAA